MTASLEYPLTPGELVAERFEILSGIGYGGMGAVMRARDLRGGGDVALKILNARSSESIRSLKRFRREAEILRSLTHPSIVRLIDSGSTPVRGITLHYLAMELVEGMSLQDRLTSAHENPLPFDEALGIFRQILSAVSFAHHHGIMHRDIKPSNILLGRDNVARLADFGVARRIDSKEMLTLPKEVMGSGYYMAPEQHKAILAGVDFAYDERCDIYALGILAFTMIAGSPPFHSEQMAWSELALLHLTQPVPPLATRGREVPSWYEQLIEGATAKDPHDRFHSVEAMLERCKESPSRWMKLLGFITASRADARTLAH